MYAIMAVGLSLIFGVMNVLNLSHGPLIILGGYVAFWLFALFNIDPLISLPLVSLIMFALGIVMNRLYIWPLITDERYQLEASATGTFGLALFITNLIMVMWGPTYRVLMTSYQFQSVPGLPVPLTWVAVMAILCISITVLHIILIKTRLGKAIRATSQDRKAAMLMGVNIPSVTAIAFGTSTLLAGVAGVLWVVTKGLEPYQGLSLLFKVFIVITLGGLGSVTGALVGGLALGVIESLATLFLGAYLKDVASFILFIILLLVRPYGIMGRPR